MKTKTAVPTNPQLSNNTIDLSTALLINGKSLELQPVKHSSPVEQKFKSEKEFIELVVNNSKILFGEHTLLMDATNTPLSCCLLLDFSDIENFKFYFVDITLSTQSFWQLFERVTRLFTFISKQDSPNMLIEILEAVIGENKPLNKELNALLDGIEINEQLFESKPFILLLTDQERPELVQITTTYSANWGKFVRPVLLKKYEDNGILYCLVSPPFNEIDFNGKPEKSVTNRQEKSTEADHLQNTSELIRSIYEKVKTDLLTEDASIEFNPKQYYVSMRKGKNLAFFHIKKKSISLVVLHPEAETRKQIQHHEIKTLTEKVQRFWNGASCMIIIENADNLEEITALLKRLIKV
jgi:predicted transport protein